MGTKTNKQRVGALGEQIACDYLRIKGHTILRRNLRNKAGEIDIITTNSDNTLCFIEVKATAQSLNLSHHKQTHDFPPVEHLGFNKIKKLIRTIEFYVRENHLLDDTWQLDGVLVFVDLKRNQAHCQHLERISLD